MAYFEYSTDNTNWITNLPQPVRMDGSLEDLDVNSYRSVVNGNIYRNVLGYKWEKISLEFNWVPETDAYTLINTVRTANNIYIRFRSPSSSTYTKTLRGYISKLSYQQVKTSLGIGYTIAFNFVEGRR